MKGLTFKKGRIGDSLFAHSFFKNFIVFVVMMIMTTSSASAEVIDGLCYDLNYDTKTATLLPKTDNEKYSGDIIIPEKVKGNDGEEYVVTEIGTECFKDCSGLTSIDIPSSVSSLGYLCFSRCSGLTSIVIPSSVTSLRDGCFKDCSGLTSIVIPSSVTYMGDNCFRGCSGLTSITIPSSVTSLWDGCFKDCSGLTSITIPSSVTSLGASCFNGCRGLTSITIPSSVTSLGAGCFRGCSGLTSITIPSSVTSLGNACFSDCSGLTSITIPSSVTSIGGYCFSDCSGLTSIAIPSSVTLWDNYCFQGCSGLTSITIPSSVTSLGFGCFSNCSGLTTITIPSSVTFMGQICFNKCDNIGTIYFKGKFPRMYNYDTGIAYTSSIKVPAEYLQDYKRILGSDYLYISAWNPDELGNDDKPVATCATPVISYESGELKFACETPGAKYHYTISDWDIIGKNAISDDGKVSLSATYHISVYATADDHTASKKAKASIYWINANLETANINQDKTRGIMASAYDGIVSISGLNNGELVKFYAADGKLLNSSSAVDGVASCAVSDSMVIAKIGMDSIKVLIK